jgi:hypothetical protein
VDGRAADGDGAVDDDAGDGADAGAGEAGEGDDALVDDVAADTAGAAGDDAAGDGDADGRGGEGGGVEVGVAGVLAGGPAGRVRVAGSCAVTSPLRLDDRDGLAESHAAIAAITLTNMASSLTPGSCLAIAGRLHLA